MRVDRAIGPLERPQNDFFRARGGKPLAVRREIHRPDFRGIAGHSKMLAILKAPSMQRIFLHRRDDEFGVRAPLNAGMGAFPFQLFATAVG